MFKKTAAKKIIALLFAAMLAAGSSAAALAATPISKTATQTGPAAPVATDAATPASSPTEGDSYTTGIKAEDVQNITVVNRDLQVGYRITNEQDRAAILRALNAIPCDGNLNEKEEMDGLMLLQVRMKDGTANNFWCHTNVFMIGNKQVATAAQAKALYDVMKRCQQAYPANIEWLAYMSPYRITSAQLDAIGTRFKVYDSAVSQEYRNVLTDVAAKLAALQVGTVVRIDDNSASTYGNGKALYKITLDFENGKEGYQVYIFDDKRVNISVDSIRYDLSYTVNDDYTYNALIQTLKAYL